MIVAAHLNRLVATLLGNNQFRDEFLADPLPAIEAYNKSSRVWRFGEKPVELNTEEKALVISIVEKSTTIQQFYELLDQALDCRETSPQPANSNETVLTQFPDLPEAEDLTLSNKQPGCNEKNFSN